MNKNHVLILSETPDIYNWRNGSLKLALLFDYDFLRGLVSSVKFLRAVSKHSAFDFSPETNLRSHDSY